MCALHEMHLILVAKKHEMDISKTVARRHNFNYCYSHILHSYLFHPGYSVQYAQQYNEFRKLNERDRKQ